MDKNGQFDQVQDESPNLNQNQGENIENQPDETSVENTEETEVNENEKLHNELAELKDKYIRLVAEFDNFRKRTAKERIELHQSAGKEVILSLLDVLDDCERAEKQFETTEDGESLKEGSRLIFAKLRNILYARGLKPLDSVGQEFDTSLHEAITTVPAASEELKGKVMDEIQKGYLLNDIILRYAKVVVGS